MEDFEKKISIDYFLSPDELELVHNEVLENGKWVDFQDIKIKHFDTILQILDKYSLLEARLGSKSMKEVYSKRMKILGDFSVERFENSVKSFNKQLFLQYDSEKKIASMSVYTYQSAIEFIIMKKALNKKGWIVERTIDFGHEKRYVLAPRKREFKTEYNKNIQNTECFSDDELNQKRTFSVRNYYRGNE